MPRNAPATIMAWRGRPVSTMPPKYGRTANDTTLNAASANPTKLSVMPWLTM